MKHIFVCKNNWLAKDLLVQWNIMWGLKQGDLYSLIWKDLQYFPGEKDWLQ